MATNLSMNEAGGIYKEAYMAYPIRIRPTKNKGSVVGGKRPKGLKQKGLKRSGMFNKKGSPRLTEKALYSKMKALIVQEYKEVLGGRLQLYRGMDLDHIHGRHAPNFPLMAMWDPRNLQLLERKVHEIKTNGTKEQQREDHRPTHIQERLIAVALRLEKKVGKAWTLYELKDAVESELYEE